MADSLAIVALALTAVGTGVSVYSSQEQAAAQEDAANFNAAVASNNAVQQQQAAEYEAARIRDRNRRILASSRADLSKNGVALSGSGLDVLSDSATQGELDALAAIYTGKVGANAQRAQSSLDRMAARNAAGTGLLNGIATGLSGAAQTGMGYYNYASKQPTFGAPAGTVNAGGYSYAPGYGVLTP